MLQINYTTLYTTLLIGNVINYTTFYATLLIGNVMHQIVCRQ